MNEPTPPRTPLSELAGVDVQPVLRRPKADDGVSVAIGHRQHGDMLFHNIQTVVMQEDSRVQERVMILTSFYHGQQVAFRLADVTMFSVMMEHAKWPEFEVWRGLGPEGS